MKVGLHLRPEYILLGYWRAGGVYWDGNVAPDDLNVWKAYCMLPGAKVNMGHYTTKAKAIEAVNEEIQYWIKKAGLK